MKILFLSLLLSAAPSTTTGGDRERGLQLYREGHYQEAAAAFRAALTSEGDSPDLQYDLALASWRAGELGAAKDAVDKFAAQSAGAGADLYAGVLGGIRFDEAKALEHKADELLGAGGQPAGKSPGQSSGKGAEKPEDPLALLEQALAKVTEAKDLFVRGAVAASSPELLRNTERALRYQDELQKKIDELKKQQEEQKKDDEKKNDDSKKDDKKDEEKKDDKKDDKKKDDKDQKGDDKKQDDKKQDGKKDDQKGDPKDQKSDEGKDGESKPEPKPGEQDAKDPKEPKPPDGKPDPAKSKDPRTGEPKDEPKPEDGKPEDGKPEDGKKEDGKPRKDAPGEMQEGKELTVEQTQRLLDELNKLDGKQRAYRARATSGRRAVERDW